MALVAQRALIVTRGPGVGIRNLVRARLVAILDKEGHVEIPAASIGGRGGVCAVTGDT